VNGGRGASNRLLSNEWERGMSPLSDIDDGTDYRRATIDAEDEGNALLQHHNDKMATIATNYNPGHENNRFGLYGSSREEVWEETELERKRATNAFIPKSWEELESAVRLSGSLFGDNRCLIKFKVVKQLEKGYKGNVDNYIVVNTRVALHRDQTELRFTDYEGLNMAWLNTGLPDYLRGPLITTLVTLFQQEIEWTDSALQGWIHVFKSVHYTYYNRCTTHVSPPRHSFEDPS